MPRLFTSHACEGHRVPPGFPELPERLAGILRRCEAQGWSLDAVPSHPAARETVLGLHDPAYVERLRQAVQRGVGWLGSGDNPLSAGTWDAAWGAVDASLSSVDHALAESGRVAFAAVRPPGHHAERHEAMGFCYFNNVALAAEHALAGHGLSRVAIVDIDVHHGNGTQHLFEERGDVFYASLHQWPFYPGTGAVTETGRGDGAGATCNIPLGAGSDDAAYREAVDSRLLPALEAFAPDLLLVSAGFDAWRGDPLGGMRVSHEGFVAWGRLLGDVAARTPARSVVAVLEGGYDLGSLPDLVVGHLQGLEAALGA